MTLANEGLEAQKADAIANERKRKQEAEKAWEGPSAGACLSILDLADLSFSSA